MALAMTDAHSFTQPLRGGFDANLELPLADPRLASFFAGAHCEVSSTTDLPGLTAELQKHRFDFSYLPSANVFFLRDRDWRGIASALSARTRLPQQSSVLVVARSNPATRWQDLKGARLGYINTYCTTSFFSPSILLAREGISLDSFFDGFPVAPWQGQIDAVLAGSIDATMVFEDVWLARAENAARTKIIARLDDLPTPPVIVRADLDPAFVQNLRSTFLSFLPAVGPTTLYAGFSTYQSVLMQRLFSELETIPGLAQAAAPSSAPASSLELRRAGA